VNDKTLDQNEETKGSSMKTILLFVILICNCTMYTYVKNEEELEIFKIQNKIVKIDTLKTDRIVYKVYYKFLIWR
jgi:hypothetical protein